MGNHINHLDVVAMRKAAIDGWEPYRYERIGNDASLITGGIPRLLKSGTRKGQKTWDGKGTRVVVTDAELDSERKRYAAATGNCPWCYGRGEVFASWHHETGTKYKPCTHCGATGKVSEEAACTAPPSTPS